MKIGISTASLYPMYTEEALLTVARLGVKNVEIFLNSITELEGEVFSCLKNTVREYGINVISVHPFSSPMETLFMFSSYDRRTTEIMDLYKKYFEMMNRLGAGIFVVHGAIATAICSDERYVERFSSLINAGRNLGVTVAQENVSYCKSARMEFLEMLKSELGNSASFVIDIKQARRSGYKPVEFLERLGKNVVHLHLSDGIGERDCLPIGEGEFNFSSFFTKLRQIGYKGNAVVELYRENYSEYSDLVDCVKKLENLDKMLEKGCN